MAECNTCGGYLSIEDKIRLSMKCDANGNVVWLGALLKQNEPEVESYIAELTTPLSSGQITNLNNLVKTIKQGLSIELLSDAFDFMQIWHNETSEAALRNIVKNAHHGTLMNNPTFTAMTGFTGNGSNAYVKLAYNASSQAVNYTLNNGSILLHSVVNKEENQADIGARVGYQNQMCYVECNSAETVNTKRCVLNTNTDVSFGSSKLTAQDEPSVGLHIYNRPDSEKVNMYINGNVYEANAATSSIPNLEWYALAINGNGTPTRFNTRTLGLIAAGRAFSKSECDVIKSAWDTYLSAENIGLLTSLNGDNVLTVKNESIYSK